MPTYTIYTKRVIEKQYEQVIELPVDMGASNEKFCDRFAIQMAETNAFTIGEDEVVTTVYGDNHQQIWPRLRKKRIKQEPIPLVASNEETEED